MRHLLPFTDMMPGEVVRVLREAIEAADPDKQVPVFVDSDTFKELEKAIPPVGRWTNTRVASQGIENLIWGGSIIAHGEDPE